MDLPGDAIAFFERSHTHRLPREPCTLKGSSQLIADGAKQLEHVRRKAIRARTGNIQNADHTIRGAEGHARMEFEATFVPFGFGQARALDDVDRTFQLARAKEGIAATATMPRAATGRQGRRQSLRGCEHERA